MTARRNSWGRKGPGFGSLPSIRVRGRTGQVREDARIWADLERGGPQGLNMLRKAPLWGFFLCSSFGRGESPFDFIGFTGTTEVVPFYKAGPFERWEDFSAACEGRVDLVALLRGLKPRPTAKPGSSSACRATAYGFVVSQRLFQPPMNMPPLTSSTWPVM